MSEPVIPGGCIFIARKIVESEIWNKPPLYIKVWLYLMLQAQHKDYRGLKRGQVSTSIPDIIDAVKWKVGARTERPTKDQVFQIIDWLRSTKTQWDGDESNAKATMITTTKATQSLLINIDNYNIYQDIKNYESNDESVGESAPKATRKQRQPDNINKNGNNANNDNKKELKTYTDEFELFWSAYPKTIGKLESFETWKTVLKNGESSELIIRCANEYAKQCKKDRTETKFIKHPKTFLNKERYKDYVKGAKDDETSEHTERIGGKYSEYVIE